MILNNELDKNLRLISSNLLSGKEASFLMSVRGHWSERTLPIKGGSKIQSIIGLSVNVIECDEDAKYWLICYQLITMSERALDLKDI